MSKGIYMNELAGELLTLSIMAFALGMDAFSVGLGMGMIQLRFRQILYIGLVIGIFHMFMPLWHADRSAFIWLAWAPSNLYWRGAAFGAGSANDHRFYPKRR